MIDPQRQRNKDDLALLDRALNAVLEKGMRESALNNDWKDPHDAFEDMRKRLERFPQATLTDKQREWAANVAGEEIYKNEFSAGLIPRGREVETPAVLRRENLPLKPPGRK